MFLVTIIGLVKRDCLQREWVMAQFGGQKNPPWATQFTNTAVSQSGHSGPPLDLNNLHCECRKPEGLGRFIPTLMVTQICNVLFWLYGVVLNFTFVITSSAPIDSTPMLPIHFFTPLWIWGLVLPNCSSWCAAAISSGSIPICLLSTVHGCSLSRQPIYCKLSAVSANCCFAAAGCSSCHSSTTAGPSQWGSPKHTLKYTLLAVIIFEALHHCNRP